jgi:hypothetical protein
MDAWMHDCMDYLQDSRATHPASSKLLKNVEEAGTRAITRRRINIYTNGLRSI